MDNISCTLGGTTCMYNKQIRTLSRVIQNFIHFKSILIDNWEVQDRAGRRFADAVYAVNGTSYTVGNGAIELYPAYGASDDYAASQDIDISTTIELPGNQILNFDKHEHK